MMKNTLTWLLTFICIFFQVPCVVASGRNNSMNTSTPVCDIQPELFYKITSGMLLPFIPVTVLGNALVCIVVYVSPIFYKQPSYILISSLAVADVLVGIVSMPIKAKLQWNHPYFCLPEFVCWIYMLEEVTFSVASAMHLFAIAAERYIGLKYPYQYKTVMSHRRIGIVVFLLWTFSFLCSLFSIFKWSAPYNISIDNQGHICANNNREFFTSLYVVCFIIPTAFMSFIYHFVYKTSARHINEITKLDVLNSPSSREKSRRNRYFRMIRSITIVFAVYTTCWIPTIVFVFLTYYMKTDYWSLKVHTEWFRIVYFFLIQFLPHFNSTLNPFIYVISNAEFRYVVYRLLFRKKETTWLVSQTNERYEEPTTRRQSELVSHTTANFLEMNTTKSADRLDVALVEDSVLSTKQAEVQPNG